MKHAKKAFTVHYQLLVNILSSPKTTKQVNCQPQQKVTKPRDIGCKV